ncbi:2'-5' RNA ligase family protein [Nocardia sp. NPDC058705]|uniref:2'-5' RNA ligase family protein n=1 Tax=Nocardia sp. NPDC058705 TaxID=3346609 RepID=UPI0036936D22
MAPSGPFPRLLPDSTSDPAAIARNDWNAFSEIEVLRDHWTVKRWAPGHTGYYWYLTFDDAELIDCVAECQDALGADGVDPVPLDALHVTLMGIGSTKDVVSDEIDRLISAARERLSDVMPFVLAVGPLSGSRSAVRFSVAPWDPLLDLHRLLSTCTSESLSNPTEFVRAKSARFRPHLGIAYNNTDRKAAEVIDAVSRLRGIHRVNVRVSHVELVVLRREGRAYRWDTRAILALGGA